MKEFLTSLAIKEIQIKMTLRFHLTPVRMVIIKKTNNTLSNKIGEQEDGTGSAQKAVVGGWWPKQCLCM
jgi:hypothetical protein